MPDCKIEDAKITPLGDGECGNCEIYCPCEKTEIKFAQEYYRLHGHAEGIEDDPCSLCARP